MYYYQCVTEIIAPKWLLRPVHLPHSTPGPSFPLLPQHPLLPLPHYLFTFLLLPPVSDLSPYTAAKPPAPQSTHPPADNSPAPQSTSAPPPAPTHSAYAQNRSSRRPSA